MYPRILIPELVALWSRATYRLCTLWSRFIMTVDWTQVWNYEAVFHQFGFIIFEQLQIHRCCCFWSIVSLCGAHFNGQLVRRSLLKFIHSCAIWKKLVPLISLRRQLSHFTLRRWKIIFGPFYVFHNLFGAFTSLWLW